MNNTCKQTNSKSIVRYWLSFELSLSSNFSNNQLLSVELHKPLIKPGLSNIFVNICNTLLQFAIPGQGFLNFHWSLLNFLLDHITSVVKLSPKIYATKSKNEAKVSKQDLGLFEPPKLLLILGRERGWGLSFHKMLHIPLKIKLEYFPMLEVSMVENNIFPKKVTLLFLSVRQKIFMNWERQRIHTFLVKNLA